jgi:ABC-type Mn2+/Zn2+ transport system ATPase subunit
MSELKSGSPAIEVTNLTTGYGRHAAIEDVTFEAPAGNLVGLLGSNGSGKSTLLKAMIGLLPTWKGEVRLLGQPIDLVRARVGYMPQAEDVDWSFPVTVRDVVAMGLIEPGFRPARLLRRNRGRVDGALESAGIAELAKRQVGALSGGQQRRTLLARTLIRTPDVLLLDEPTAGLDVRSEEEFLEIIQDLARDGRTVVVATHDISCVQRVYDFALCLNRSVVAFGPPETTLTAETLAATFGRHLLHVGDDRVAEPHVAHPGT